MHIIPCCCGQCPTCGKYINFLYWDDHTKKHAEEFKRIRTKRWRTLVRITQVKHEGVKVIVPGFSSTKEVTILWHELPFEIHHWFYEEGKRLHAKVNIGAESRKDLKFSDWEEH